MSTWVPSLPLGPAGYPIPNPGLGLLGPLIGGTVPVVANVLGAAIVSELLFPQTVADGTLDGNWRQVYRDWGTENFNGQLEAGPVYPPGAASITGEYKPGMSHRWLVTSGGAVFSQPGFPNFIDPPRSGTSFVADGEVPYTPSLGVGGTGQYAGKRVVLVIDGVATTATYQFYNDDRWSLDSWGGGTFVLDAYAGTQNGPTQNVEEWFAAAPVEFTRTGSRDGDLVPTLADPFTNPGDGAAQVGQVGTGAPALGEQLADAIAGAGIAVAAPPSPQLPGSSPVGVPGGGGGASSSPEGQQVTGTGVAGGSAPLAPAPLAPLPLPAPVLPGPAPLAPSTAPALPGTPTEAAPAGAPALPGSQPLDNTGNPVPPAVVAPGATPPGQEMTPLGPVGGPAQQPAATLQGIAAEVGKVEQKVLQLQRELQSPPGSGQLVPPWALPLLEALFSLGDGVTYSIPQPCGVDAEGNPEPPVVITVPGALDQFDVIKNRIDGLAELIAVHKVIKQPVCKAPAIQGQGVTVTFEQTPGG